MPLIHIQQVLVVEPRHHTPQVRYPVKQINNGQKHILRDTDPHLQNVIPIPQRPHPYLIPQHPPDRECQYSTTETVTLSALHTDMDTDMGNIKVDKQYHVSHAGPVN